MRACVHACDGRRACVCILTPTYILDAYIRTMTLAYHYVIVCVHCQPPVLPCAMVVYLAIPGHRLRVMDWVLYWVMCWVMGYRLWVMDWVMYWIMGWVMGYGFGLWAG